MATSGFGLWSRYRRDVLFRLWVAIILSIALATGVNTYFVVESYKEDADAALSHRVEQLADVLVKSLARPLFDINTLAIASVVTAIGMDKEVAHLRVLSPDDEVLVDAGGQLSPDQRTVRVQRDVKYVFEDKTYDVGTVELALSAADIDNKLKQEILQAAVSWLVLVFAISLSLYMVSRRITRPFADIQSALDRLAAGDTNVVLSGIGREDQVGRLSVAVDRFRSTLDELHLAERTSEQLIAEKSAMADRLKAIYEGSSDAIMLLTEQGFFDCNQRALDMFGFSTRAEFIGCHPSMLSPPRQHDGRDSFIAANEKIAEALAQGCSRFEWTHRHIDGTEFPAEIVLSAFDYDGKRVLQATVRDIAERKRIELELQQLNVDLESRIDARTREITAALSRLEESRHKLQAIVDTALDAVVRIDASGAIIGWNAQAEAIFGWPVEQILGLRLEETIVPAQHRAAHCGGMARYMATGVSAVIDKRIEISAVRRDGTEIPIELAITRVALEDSQQFEFCAFIRDITRRRQAEAEFRNSLEKQRELNTLKSRFITMASHEFRTPLATILSSTELLQNYLERLPQSERDDLFRSISLAVRRMSSMLEEILFIGKDDAERATFSPSMVDLEKLFGILVKEVLVEQADLHETRHAIDVTFCCNEPRGLFDERLLRHIFGNLLSNAVKYSSASDPVTCSMECNAAEFVFTIRDSGIGIPEEDMPRLFGNFHRAGNVGNIPGTGLGLAIVKRSVDLHSGTITVQSTVGKGTTFSVRLPRQSPDNA